MVVVYSLALSIQQEYNRNIPTWVLTFPYTPTMISLLSYYIPSIFLRFPIWAPQLSPFVRKGAPSRSRPQTGETASPAERSPSSCQEWLYSAYTHKYINTLVCTHIYTDIHMCIYVCMILNGRCALRYASGILQYSNTKKIWGLSWTYFRGEPQQGSRTWGC